MNTKRLVTAGAISYPRPRFHPATPLMVWAVYGVICVCIGVAIGAAVWGPK